MESDRHAIGVTTRSLKGHESSAEKKINQTILMGGCKICLIAPPTGQGRAAHVDCVDRLFHQSEVRCLSRGNALSHVYVARLGGA